MIYFLLFIIIIFIPIPIKISINYNKNLNIYIYKIKIKKKPKKKKHISTKSNFTFREILDILSILNKSKFKPILFFNLDFEYGFSDAAITAISYGVFTTLLGLIHNKSSDFFKLKKFNGNININYENQIVKLSITSIIFINIANIIYDLGFIYLAVYKNKRR
ncbi:MAG: DUF2953 domain-containing protein [Clostridiaceae bacterium]